MPIPKPNEDEKKEEFVERCMVDKTMVAEYDEDQRYAICSRVYDEETEDVNTKDMEEKNQVYIIMGASCSGKSTYVRNNANAKDLIFDFDTIHQAISNNESHIHIDSLKKYVFDVRDALYERLKKDKTTNAWIINSSPYKQVRKQLVKDLDAKIIYIQRSKEECLQIAENERPSEWRDYINNYFENLKYNN